jgi:hypothetical protein
MAANGLGPCKRASQANHGTIDINLPAADQTAVIAITAHSPENTRVRLICTDITDAAVFTVRMLLFYAQKIFECIENRIFPSKIIANWHNCNHCRYT